MIITTSDLIYLNDSARALKQKDVILYRNMLVGIDNFNYIILLYLNADKLHLYQDRGIIVNQRNLSAFIKTISTESEFEIREPEYSGISSITTISSNLDIRFDENIKNVIINRIATANDIDRKMDRMVSGYIERDVTQELKELYSLTKTSGSILYHFDQNHLMTLFSGVIPLAKSDKLFLQVLDNSRSTFLARFRVQKKQSTVFVYLAYLKI